MDNAPSDDRTRVDLLRRRREELLEMKRKLKGMLGDLDVLIAEAEGRSVALQPAPNMRPPGVSAETGLVPARQPNAGRPLRAIVLDALEDIEWPTYSRELSQFCSAQTGRTILAERFGSLANDEVKSFKRSLEGGRVRPLWLCFALTHDRHQPIKRLWARSDWPLERRIIAPTSGRIQHLKLTAKLCELAQREGAANPEMMHILAADHARDLPGVRVQRGKFELDTWRTTALTLLKDLGPRDAEARMESAARLRDRGPFIHLFGVPDVEDVDVLPENRQRRG